MLEFLKGLLRGDPYKAAQRYQPLVRVINDYEGAVSELTNEELQGKTPEFKQRLAQGEPIKHLLPEAFAVVREAAKRTLNMRHFDVQLVGGMVLNDGQIAEMKTGEGKTLVATLPAYLNALAGQGVHVVTVNDYLAQRDAAWMGKVHSFLGLNVGCILANQHPTLKRQAYAADITYGTNNEFGFDYLRDNMAGDAAHCVQRALHYAIVDEVDSILVDEARTPLIISGMLGDTTEKYQRCAQVAQQLEVTKDFTLDEKTKNAIMLEEGVSRAEQLLGIANIYDLTHMDYAHMVVQCLKAKYLYKRDVDYVVREGEVVIVDEFTGRLMEGRRYSDGLHQAIEAVESLRIREESQTLATITFQNYFRLYQKLAGMTGTAKTEEEEFFKIYNLPVLCVPPNKAMIRADRADYVFKNKVAKYNAIIEEITKLFREEKRPVLVGTISIETSELLASLLKKRGVPHEVLNAKQHAREAEIVARAGQAGAVTIATNMAGRGTDIVLGEGVAAMGGLHIIGTERHEARRIDNQLRGRSGRQGDPGSSRFYLSLEDDLMRLFGGERVQRAMEMLKMPEDEPIEHGLITKSVERAQKKVEQYHFGIRKQLLQYDDVMNTQRETIYRLRRKILLGENLRDRMVEMLSNVVKTACEGLLPEKGWDLNEIIADDLSERLLPVFPFLQIPTVLQSVKDREAAAKGLSDQVLTAYGRREQELGPTILREMERAIMLREIDSKWVDHLHNMDVLREGIGLRAYGQKDPLIEYKIEAYDMFSGLMNDVESAVSELIFKVEVLVQPVSAAGLGDVRAATPPGMREVTLPMDRIKNVSYSSPERNLLDARSQIREAAGIASNHAVASDGGRSTTLGSPSLVASTDPYARVGRNEPCPCGSGKKFKKCHGAG